MKTDLSLSALAAEIERQQNAKRDFVADTGAMAFVASEDLKDNELAIGLPTVDAPSMAAGGVFPMNNIAHGQIAEHVGIPVKYYDRMRHEKPELLAYNVNTWFKADPKPRMVRTLDNRARAFLSDRYKPLDYAELAEAVLPTLLELKLHIMSCSITERRLYIKAVDERIQRDVPTGRKIGDGSHVFFDTCSPGIVISNSEVGMGRLTVEYGIFTKVCTNLATIAGEGMKRAHLGARHDLTDNLQHLLTDETKQATDKAIWMQVRDVVQSAFDEMRFTQVTDRMSGMSSNKIENDVPKVIELAAKRFGFNEGERSSILRHLIEGADLTQYGLFNAITRTAEDAPSYDRASELEAVGGAMLDLDRGAWRELAAA